MPNDERIIPTTQPSDLPSIKILSSGKEISGEYQVLSVEVVRVFNRIASAKILILDGDAATATFKVSESDDFKPGKEIDIQAGYHEEVESVFKGIILKHQIKAKKGKPSFLTIEAKDKAVKMTVVRKSAYFYDKKDSDIIEELAGKSGLQKDIASTDLKHKEMVQYNVTDWDFVVSRAEMNGHLVSTQDGKLITKKPDTSTSPVLTLTYGSNLMEFEAEMDARKQFSGIKSSGWDMAEQKLLEADAASPSFAEAGNISADDLAAVLGITEYPLKNSGALKEQELKSWANAQSLKSKASKIRGRVRFQGINTVKLGVMLEVKGVGERFNGKVYVSGLRHQITKENWETDVQFGLSDEWFYQQENIIEKPASGLVPAISGLQVGIVVKLEADPEGEDRIQVRIPIISTQEDGVWARIATLDAGKERGSFFRPEIGDEVIVGFINDDPRSAVVLGCLNSSKNPAPLKASDKNPQKGIITREKMKFIFDDEKKIITIETPAGKKFIMDEDAGKITIQDENSNKIEMSSDGIVMESGKDFKIKATKDFTVEGVNVKLKASAQLAAEGSAGAEFKSSAICTVKGSMVQIN